MLNRRQPWLLTCTEQPHADLIHRDRLISACRPPAAAAGSDMRATVLIDAEPTSAPNCCAARVLPDLLGHARSRSAIQAASLDEMASGEGMNFNLRYALAHMIEETARHCGHLDILRERIDGSAGE
jgi:hypothetical protein